MIPVTLRLQGFLSYREKAELSFEDFDLACISGANGAGKSSLLDAITWVLFGKARRSDDALISTACDTAEVVLDFDYETARYRVQRVKTRAKTTVLEFFIYSDAGQWQPLTEATMTATQKRIEDTLRLDYDTFINASFFLQGKADEFTKKNSTQRKEILSSILGLDIWERYRDAARAQRRQIDNEIQRVDAQLQEIETELGEEEERKNNLAALQKELEEKQKQRAAQQLALQNAQKVVQAIEEREKLLRVLADQLHKEQQALAEVGAKIKERLQEEHGFKKSLTKADDIEARFKHWQALRQQLADLDGKASQFHQLNQQRLGLEKEIAVAEEALLQQIRQLEEQRKQNAFSQKEAQQLQVKQASLQKGLQKLQPKTQQQTSLLDEIQSEQGNAAQLQAENKRLKDLMDGLKKRMDALQPDTGSANCPLCGQPLSVAHRQKLLAELHAEGTALGDTFRQNKAAWQASVEKTQQLQQTMQDLQRELKELNDQQRQADQLQHQLDLIDQANQQWQEQDQPRLTEAQTKLEKKEFAPDAQNRITDLQVQIARLGYQPQAHEELRTSELHARTVEDDYRQLEMARSRLEPLKREIQELQEQQTRMQSELTAHQEHLSALQNELQAERSAQPDVAALQEQLQQAQLEENKLSMQVGAAKQLVSVLDALRERKKDYRATRQSLAHKSSQLLILEEAFGKDGVPALLIEQALPEIEMRANDILDRLSAGGMSVRFETQREFKDKKREDKKQVLDILISDAAGVREYELFSGGEAFRVNFAIRLALSRVLAQRAGARLQTLVIDEGFGSQDTEGRQRLVEAINVVRPDFAKIIVITHLEELKDAFPARIEVEKTALGSQVQVVS